MNGQAGIRRTRTGPVVLADCPFSALPTGCRVLVAHLSGVDEPEYVADVVFGPQQVITTAEHTSAARIVRVLPDETATITATAGIAAPLWIRLAPPALFPSASVGQNLPRDAAEVIAAGAALLVEIDSGRYDLHGFAHDLPALGQEIVLADHRTATVTGIDGKHGVLRARLADGQEIEGPLPGSEGLTAWTATPRESQTAPGRDGHERQRRGRSSRG